MKKNNIGITISNVLNYAFTPIEVGIDFFVEAGTKYNLDDNVDDSFLQEFTGVDDVDALISLFDDVDATELMSIDKFNFKLLTDEAFYVDVVEFLAEQFKKSCEETQLIVQENNGLGKPRTFRVIWYDGYYNEDWVDYTFYLNDVLTCFDIDIKRIKDEKSFL